MYANRQLNRSDTLVDTMFNLTLGLMVFKIESTFIYSNTNKWKMVSYALGKLNTGMQQKSYSNYL